MYTAGETESATRSYAGKLIRSQYCPSYEEEYNRTDTLLEVTASLANNYYYVKI